MNKNIFKSLIVLFILLFALTVFSAGTVHILQPNNIDYITGKYAISFEYQDSAFKSYKTYEAAFTFTDSSNVQLMLPSTLPLDSSSCNKTNFSTKTLCSLDWDSSNFSDGTFTLEVAVNVTDSTPSGPDYSNSDKSDSSFVVDNTAPTVHAVKQTGMLALLLGTAPPNFTANAGFANSSFNFIFDSSDNASGIDYTEYSLEGASFIKGKNTQTVVSISEPSVNSFVFRAFDKAGNKTEITITGSFDDEPPEFSNPFPADGGYTNNLSTPMSVYVYDAVSGVYLGSNDGMDVSRQVLGGGITNYSYTWGFAPELTFVNNVFKLDDSATFGFTDGDIVTVTAKASDVKTLGTQGTYSWTFTVDSQSPSTIVSLNGNLTQFNNADLTWSASADAQCFSHYNIYRNTTNVTTTNKASSLLAVSALTSFSDYAVNGGNTYYYRVTGVDCAGNESTLSNEVSVSVPSFSPVIKVTPSTTNLFMQASDVQSISFNLKNIGNAQECLSLNTDTGYSSFIQTSLNKGTLCLNPGENEDVLLTIKTINAPATISNIFFKALTSIPNYEISTINITTVKSSFPISINNNTGSICNSGSQRLSINVTNNNSTPETVSLEVTAGEFFPYFDTTSIDLAGYQSKKVNINLSLGSNERQRDTAVGVKAVTNDGIISEMFTYTVSGCTQNTPEFNLTVPGACVQAVKGANTKENIVIENLKNETINVKLQAIAGFPLDIPLDVALAPLTTKIVEVSLLPRHSDILGQQDVEVHAYTDNYNQTKTFCANLLSGAATGIGLAATGSCIPVIKEDSTDINILVENFLNKPTTVNLEATGDIPAVIQNDTFILPGQSEIVSLSLRPRLKDDSGLNHISLYAWTSDNMYYDSRDVCANVLPKQKSALTLSTTSVSLKKEQTEVVELIIENIGDTTQNYDISLNNPSLFSTNLSGKTFSLQEDDAENIFLSITADSFIAPGTYFIDVLLEDNSKIYTEKIVVNVFDLDLPEVMIASSPQIVYVSPGTSKTIDLILINNSSKAKDISLSVSGLPEGISFEEKDVSLNAFETVTFPVKFTALASATGKEATASFDLFEGNKKLDSKEVVVSTNPEGTGFFSGTLEGLTGFVNFFGSPFMLVLLLLLVIVGASFFVFGKGQDVEQAQKEQAWSAHKEQEWVNKK